MVASSWTSSSRSRCALGGAASPARPGIRCRVSMGSSHCSSLPFFSGNNREHLLHLRPAPAIRSAPARPETFPARRRAPAAVRSARTFSTTTSPGCSPHSWRMETVLRGSSSSASKRPVEQLLPQAAAVPRERRAGGALPAAAKRRSSAAAMAEGKARSSRPAFPAGALETSAASSCSAGGRSAAASFRGTGRAPAPGASNFTTGSQASRRACASARPTRGEDFLLDFGEVAGFRGFLPGASEEAVEEGKHERRDPDAAGPSRRGPAPGARGSRGRGVFRANPRRRTARRRAGSASTLARSKRSGRSYLAGAGFVQQLQACS